MNDQGSRLVHPESQRESSGPGPTPATEAGSLSLSKGRVVARILLSPYLLALLLLTLLPGPEAGKVTGIVAAIATWLGVFDVPFATAYPLMEFLANVALFVPFGLLLVVAWSAIPRGRIIAAGFATSGAIELIQLALPTRFSTLSDLIANTLGTIAGCAVAVILLGFGRTRRPTLER